ncbi:MAG: nitroreductase family protein [Pseudomonadota bacterium]|nr:nitroreductase family protein [Pseudomonadota bacterium]
MWDFFETIRHRHSVRHYRSDHPVSRQQLHAILEMACAAPSAGDLQSYRIAVATTVEQRQALQAASGDQSFLAEAPVCLVFCTDPERAAMRYGERGRTLYAIQDATIAASYAQLAAVAAGLASAWVGNFDEDAVRSALALPDHLQPIALIVVGMAAEVPEATPRRPLKDILIQPYGEP